MLQIKIISFKNSPIPEIVSLESDLLTRTKRFAKLDLIELNSSKFSKLPPAQLLLKEAEMIRKEISGADYLITLTEFGKQFTSEQLAKWVSQRQTTGDSRLVLVLGSPYGLLPELRKEAKLELSLSPLTFTAQFARLILIEQLYRCFAINNNLPYHKAGI